VRATPQSKAVLCVDAVRTHSIGWTLPIRTFRTATLKAHAVTYQPDAEDNAGWDLLRGVESEGGWWAAPANP
jgi:hypothetical protein